MGTTPPITTNNPQNTRSTKPDQTSGSKRRDYVFQLTGAQGFERSYRIPASEADGKSERGQEPYVTVMDACCAEGTKIGISVYQHTGIVVDAWKTN